MFGLSWLFPSKSNSIRVNYDTALYLPKGTAGVKSDRPAATGVQQVAFSDIILDIIPSGMTLRDYLAARQDKQLWDARLLDALFQEATRRNSAEWIRKELGQGRLVFFLGTTFVTHKGQEVAPFLNLSSALPAIRYVYPIGQKVGGNHGSGDPILEALGIHPPTAYVALLPNQH